MSTIHALKEWDAQIQALETGQTTLVMRKGGITEARGEFEVEHREFWLYPTFLHQNPGELRPKFSSLIPYLGESRSRLALSRKMAPACQPKVSLEINAHP